MSFKREGDDHSWLNTLKRRRVSELFAVNIAEDEAYLMKNGRFACLVCRHRPVFDTINSLAVHRGGCKHAAHVEEFLSKKTELNYLQLKRQQELFVCSGQLPVTPQPTKPAVHKLLGARMYDSRTKRPKLKATDRRPTVDVTATPGDEATDNSCDCEKRPQTIDELRRLRNQRTQNAQQILKPYVGKRTSILTQGKEVHGAGRVPEPEQCVTTVAVSTTANCNTPTSLNIKASQCQESEMVCSVDTSCLGTEKLVQYLHAVGSGWKRSRDGSWVKDENAEFDSDEEAPDF